MKLNPTRPVLKPAPKSTVDPKLYPDRWAMHQQPVGKVGRSTRKPNT